MAHGIMENDHMFSANGERPWHGLGTIIDEAPTTQEAIRIAKLDWRVEKLPLVAKSAGSSIPIKDTFALMRMDTDFCCGVVKNRYEIVQNMEAFAFVDEIMKAEVGMVRYETAGSLFNGKKVFLLVRMPDSKILGDVIENYLFFTNSHDGLSAVRAGISNVRIVCDNTLQMAMAGAPRAWRAPHTKTVKKRQEEAIHSLKLASAYIGEMPKVAEKMAAKKIKIEDVAPLFWTKSELELPTVQNDLQNIIAIAKNKTDLTDFRGTAWGAYNAVADFLSNPNGRKGFRSGDRKMNAFLVGHSLLSKAQKVLMSA